MKRQKVEVGETSVGSSSSRSGDEYLFYKLITDGVGTYSIDIHICDSQPETGTIRWNGESIIGGTIFIQNIKVYTYDDMYEDDTGYIHAIRQNLLDRFLMTNGITRCIKVELQALSINLTPVPKVITSFFNIKNVNIKLSITYFSDYRPNPNLNMHTIFDALNANFIELTITKTDEKAIKTVNDIFSILYHADKIDTITITCKGDISIVFSLLNRYRLPKNINRLIIVSDDVDILQSFSAFEFLTEDHEPPSASPSLRYLRLDFPKVRPGSNWIQFQNFLLYFMMLLHSATRVTIAFPSVDVDEFYTSLIELVKYWYKKYIKILGVNLKWIQWNSISTQLSGHPSNQHFIRFRELVEKLVEIQEEQIRRQIKALLLRPVGRRSAQSGGTGLFPISVTRFLYPDDAAEYDRQHTPPATVAVMEEEEKKKG